MKLSKRVFICLLASVLLFTCFTGCALLPWNLFRKQTPTASPALETPKPTPVSTPVATEPTTPSPDPLSEEDQRFLALDNEMFIDRATSEITALDQFCGNPENFGIDESTVPVTLGEFTEEANDEWIEQCRVWREKLSEIDRDDLCEQYQFAYDTYLRYFDMEIESADYFFNYEPLDKYVGIHLNLPLFFGLYTFKDETDISNYLTLLADTPRYYGQILAFEEERAERGLFMTEKMLDVILADLLKVAESGETSFLHETFREAMEKQDYLSDAQREAYIAKNDALVKTDWVNAYRLLYDGLSALRPKCRARVGAYEQGGNAYAYFCWKMKAEAANNRTVQDELLFLEDCAGSIFYIFYDAARKSYNDLVSGKRITTGSLAGDEAYLRKLLPQIVPTMPDVEVTYTEVPKELQDSFSPAAYLTPPFDDYRHNIILTNPKNQNQYSMSTLAHEGFPGHMYQFTYQYSLGTIPKFQMMIESNGYAESWSTNAEYNIAQINETYGTDLAVATFLNGYYTDIIVTICSLLVNGYGVSYEEIESYLSQQGLGDYTQDFYDYAIDMPIYFFKYTGGFCELYDLTNRYCKDDKVAFFREYLKWGPSYFDLLDARMKAWSDAQ